MRALNVKKVTKTELEKQWDIEIPPAMASGGLFIRCNVKGEVKWDNAPVYDAEYLVERGNYKVH